MENPNNFIDKNIQNRKIALGELIRNFIFNLNSILIDLINRYNIYSYSNSLETKQRFATYIVNTHSLINMLHKFIAIIRNSRRFEEIQVIYKLFRKFK